MTNASDNPLELVSWKSDAVSCRATSLGGQRLSLSPPFSSCQVAGIVWPLGSAWPENAGLRGTSVEAEQDEGSAFSFHPDSLPHNCMIPGHSDRIALSLKPLHTAQVLTGDPRGDLFILSLGCPPWLLSCLVFWVHCLE